MSLSELMSNMDLAIWPQIALVIFLTIFVVVVVKTFAKSQQAQHEAARFLPLEDEETKTKVNGHA